MCVFHAPACWWCPRSFDGTCNATVCQKMVFHCVTRSTITWSSSRPGACRWWSNGLSPVVVFYFYCLLFSLFRLKCMFVLFFNFIPYVFYCLFSSLTLLEKLYMFSIQSLNYNLSYIVFTDSVLILLICHFYPWIFF